MVIMSIAIPLVLVLVLASVAWVFNELYNSRFRRINTSLDTLYELQQELDVDLQKLRRLLEESKKPAPTPKKKSKERNPPSPEFSGKEFNVQAGRKKK